MKGVSFVLAAASLLIACAPAGRADKAAPPQVPTKDPWAEMRQVVLAPADKAAERMSLVRILADPKAVDGRPVAVGGYMHLEFEGNHFCLHKDDVENLIVSNCIWISVPSTPEVKALSDNYVWVEGVVDAQSKGHKGLLQASLVEIKSIGVPPTRTLIQQHLKEQRQKQ